MKAFDNKFLSEKIKFIAGVDEAGRGPLAGPVVAAAVIFDSGFYLEEVNDSKKLSGKSRESIFPKILENAVSYGVGIVWNEEIDRINILQASLKAMKIAVTKLSLKPDLVLIDGNKTFFSELNTKAVIKGDAKSFAIAAASIIAKVTRDKIMVEASRQFPEYGWERNKGYGTKEHISAIKKFGITPLHRKSFLSNILETQISLNDN